MFFWQNPAAALSKRHDSEILEGIAKGEWASQWANRQEEKGESFSGVDVYYAAPSPNRAAKKWARELADKIVEANGKSLDELYDLAVSYGFKRAGPRGGKEHFGSSLGLQSTGTGVRWSDDVRGVPKDAIKVPHTMPHFAPR